MNPPRGARSRSHSSGVDAGVGEQVSPIAPRTPLVFIRRQAQRDRSSRQPGDLTATGPSGLRGQLSTRQFGPAAGCYEVRKLERPPKVYSKQHKRSVMDLASAGKSTNHPVN